MTTKDFIVTLLKKKVFECEKYVRDGQRHLDSLQGYGEATKRPVAERLEGFKSDLAEANHHLEVFTDQILEV